MMVYAFAIIPMIITIFLLIHLYNKYGKDVRVKKSSRFIIKPPADVSPSVLGALLNPDGLPKEENFLAELLYLAHKRYIDIMERYVGDKKQVVLLKLKKDKKLDTSEKIVFGYLFKKKCAVVLDDALRSSKRFRDCIKNWQAIAHKEARTYQHKHGWFHEHESKKIVRQLRDAGVLVLVLSAAGILFSLNCGAFGGPFFETILGFLAGVLLSSILVLLFSGFLYRRSAMGSREYQKWMDFKASLEKYFTMHKKPPSAVALWDELLIYAVSLGTAKNVIAKMKWLSFSRAVIRKLLGSPLRF